MRAEKGGAVQTRRGKPEARVTALKWGEEVGSKLALRETPSDRLRMG